jgi:hypothetical protein
MLSNHLRGQYIYGISEKTILPLRKGKYPYLYGRAIIYAVLRNIQLLLLIRLRSDKMSMEKGEIVRTVPKKARDRVL